MIRKFLDISTSHLKPETLTALTDRPLERLPFSGGPTPYGWFAYTHDENCGEGDARIPDEMFACMKHARALDCDYVMFDCDSEVIEGLPVFDHDSKAEG